MSMVNTNPSRDSELRNWSSPVKGCVPWCFTHGKPLNTSPPLSFAFMDNATMCFFFLLGVICWKKKHHLRTIIMIIIIIDQSTVRVISLPDILVHDLRWLSSAIYVNHLPLGPYGKTQRSRTSVVFVYIFSPAWIHLNRHQSILPRGLMSLRLNPFILCFFHKLDSQIMSL